VKRARKREHKADAPLSGEGGLRIDDALIEVIGPEERKRRKMLAGIKLIDALVSSSSKKIDGEYLAKLREARATFVLYADKIPLSPTAQGFVDDALELIGVARHNREKMAHPRSSQRRYSPAIPNALDKVLTADPQNENLTDKGLTPKVKAQMEADHCFDPVNVRQVGHARRNRKKRSARP
jgi:hypothetical protein